MTDPINNTSADQASKKSDTIWSAGAVGAVVTGGMLLIAQGSEMMGASHVLDGGGNLAGALMFSAGIMVGGMAMERAIELATPQGSSLWANMMEGNWGNRLGATCAKWKGVLGVAIYMSGYAATTHMMATAMQSGGVDFSDKLAVAGVGLVAATGFGVSMALKKAYRDQIGHEAKQPAVRKPAN